MGDIKNLGVNTTGGKCYIVELRPPYQKLEIQFVPDEISLTSSANNAKIDIVGRNNPLVHYTGGNDKLKLTLDFYSDEANRKDVLLKVRWLQSLRYADGSFGPKRNISVVLGDLFRREIWTVDSVNIKLSNLDGQFNFMPRQAFVDLDLTLDPKTNLRIDDVRGNI